jgi:Rod binding domain-containing protein
MSVSAARPLPATVDPAIARRLDPKGAIRAKADEFEQVYLNTMLGQMFAGVGADPLTGGGHAEDQWRSLQVDQYAGLVTKAGGIGVSNAIYGEMLRLQETNIR